MEETEEVEGEDEEVKKGEEEDEEAEKFSEPDSDENDEVTPEVSSVLMNLIFSFQNIDFLRGVKVYFNVDMFYVMSSLNTCP